MKCWFINTANKGVSSIEGDLRSLADNEDLLFWPTRRKGKPSNGINLRTVMEIKKSSGDGRKSRENGL